MPRIKRRHVVGVTVCIVLFRRRQTRIKRRNELRKWRRLNRSVHGLTATSPAKVARRVAPASN